MDDTIIAQLIIEDAKISLFDVSSAKLRVNYDNLIKEFYYPFKDIYFQVATVGSNQSLGFSFISAKSIVEGSTKISSLRLANKIRIQLKCEKDPVGYIAVRVQIYENFSSTSCKHCEKITEIITHVSKTSYKSSRNLSTFKVDDLGLEINLKHLDSKEILYQPDIKYVKNLLIGAHEKIKTFECKNIIDNSEKISGKNSSAIGVIDYQKIIITLEQKINNQNKTIDELHNENKNLADSFAREKSVNKNNTKELEALQLETNILKGEMVKIRANRRRTGVIESTLEELVECKKQLESELKNLRETYKKSIEEFSVTTKSYEESMKKLNEEKTNVENHRDKLAGQVKDLKNQIDSLNSVINNLKAEIFEKEAKVKVYENFNKESLAEQITRESVATLYAKIESDKKRFSEFAKLMRKEKNDLLQKNNEINNELVVVRDRIEGVEASARSTQLKYEESLENVKSLKLKLNSIRLDSEILSQMRDMKSQIFEVEASQNKQLDSIVKFTLDLSQKFLFQQRLITKLFKYIQDKDCEICMLRNKITIEQSSINIYVPDKADNIDVAMGDYINTRPTFLEVPFSRIEHGVYLFGSKIVKVKYQNNRLIMCLGGGFMSIDEFITIFTPPELEKMNERKRHDQAAGMRMTVNDSLTFLNSEGEISPIDVGPKRYKREVSMSGSGANALSRDSSFISNHSPMAQKPAFKRSLTRMNSLVTKY